MVNLCVTASRCTYLYLSCSSNACSNSLSIIYTDYDFYDKRNSNEVKAIWAVLIISTLLGIFIPSNNTLIAMYIANHITPDNLSNAQEIITTIIKQAH